ncbi:MAG TPA: metal-dependent transcriptional regulator [Candidatus Acidoferrales bacterium]|nr:metal-dependent transcriptional regulator [Candidatus Acidoferrales bacterium]
MLVLTRSRQDYLKALFALSPTGQVVATSRLAAHLGVKAPSVTNMIARLARERLVSHSPRAGARLTPRGRREALGIVRRHRILEAFLVRVLGLDLAEVHEDAEVLEHHVSDRLLEAIDRLMRRPTEDPHGHPIPNARGRLLRRALLPLAALRRGVRARVREIDDEDARRLARWRELGLVPGAAVRVREVRPLDGVVELEVTGRRHVTSIASLEGILVQRAHRGSDGP